MVDFISEVQEELRKDDYNKWLKRYGPFALAGIFTVIAGAGFMEWTKAQKAKEARLTSSAYIAASETAASGETEKAIAEFLTISQTAPEGYSGLSLMRAAELELDQGAQAKSISLLDQAAETFELARHQQLAQIKAAYILAGNGDYDNVIVRARPLAEKGQPYEYLARELLGFAAKENGDLSGAREQFSYLNTIPGVPPSVQQRAKQYLDLMAVDSIGKIPAPDVAADPLPAPSETTSEEGTENVPAETE